MAPCMAMPSGYGIVRKQLPARRAVFAQHADLATNVDESPVHSCKSAARRQQFLLRLVQPHQHILASKLIDLDIPPGDNHRSEQLRLPDQRFVERDFCIGELAR